jgi:thiazole synthase
MKTPNLTIAGKEYRSRLIVGTGKYASFRQTREALDASGAEMITVAVQYGGVHHRGGGGSHCDAGPRGRCG